MPQVRTSVDAEKAESETVRDVQAVPSKKGVSPQEKGCPMRNSIAWRSNPELVSAAAEILADPVVSQMMATLELDHPARGPSQPKDGCDATYRVGLIDGFELCLRRFESLGKNLPQTQSPIESTFGPQQ